MRPFLLSHPGAKLAQSAPFHLSFVGFKLSDTLLPWEGGGTHAHTHTKPNGQKKTMDGGTGVGWGRQREKLSRKKDEKEDWLEEKMKLHYSHSSCSHGGAQGTVLYSAKATSVGPNIGKRGGEFFSSTHYSRAELCRPVPTSLKLHLGV